MRLLRAAGLAYLGVRRYGRANNRNPRPPTKEPTDSHRALFRCAPVPAGKGHQRRMPETNGFSETDTVPKAKAWRKQHARDAERQGAVVAATVPDPHCRAKH
jgi:hypothetical protein